MERKNLSKRTKKICILALGAYPLFACIKPKNIVGPDVHQAIFAKEIIKYGFDVSVIVYGETAAIEHINEIEIIKIKDIDYRLRIIRIISKSFLIWNGMRKAEAHIYFQPGGIGGIMPLFCKLFGKQYIYRVASDAVVNRQLVTRNISDFSRSMLNISTFCYWLDIKLADVIIVQNKHQLSMLKKNFKRNGILIKSPMPYKGIYKKEEPPIVLWVGSMADVKQPELFVKLAKLIPQIRFQMIGGHSSNNENLYNTIKDEAKNVINLELLGVVPFDEIDEYFGRASILVNTSMFEGFPNAFIQAWMHCVPVITLNANPDRLISKYKLGFHSKRFEQMVEDVKTLLDNPVLRKEMGMNGRKYFEKEHEISKIIGKYNDVLNNVLTI